MFNWVGQNNVSNSPEITNSELQRCLLNIIEPHYNTDLISADAVESLEVIKGHLKLNLNLHFPCELYAPVLKYRLSEMLEAIPGVESADVSVSWKVPSASSGTPEPLKGVKNVIAVASGKGGVGKSTVTANLAVALAAEGARVGVLDADIYGPSQPRMLGGKNEPETFQKSNYQPIESNGVYSMSMGYMVDEDLPMIWRGPMITKALQQLLTGTDWPEIDYLFIDLPPGTGDVQLSLSQSTPITGAVIVTTPQEIALLDARRGISMFHKVDVNVLGILENMSSHVCPSCGHEESIFGTGGGRALAAEQGVHFLGEIPLDTRIREQADSGLPIVTAEPDSELAERYREIARATAAHLYMKNRHDSHLDIAMDDG